MVALKTPIQILLCADEGYIHQSFVVALSVLKHMQQDRALTVHFVYCHDATKSGAYSIAAYCDQLSKTYPSCTFNIIEFDVTSMFHGENRLHISAATLARLIPTRWLSGKVLYLDADLVVLDDVVPLFDTDLAGKLMGVVRSYDLMFYARKARYKEKKTKFYRHAETILGADHAEDYFNAGVLLLDLDAWAARDVDAKLAARNYGQDLHLRDQDVLNQVALGDVKFLHGRWNAIKGWAFLKRAGADVPYRDEWEGCYKAPAIAHFAGRKKPWQYRNFNWFRPYYKWIKLYRAYWNELVVVMAGTGASLKDKV